MPLGLQGALVAIFQTIEGDVDQVFVHQKMLTFLISEDDHEGFDQRVSQMRVQQLLVVLFNVLHAYLLDLLGVFILLLGAPWLARGVITARRLTDLIILC